MARWTQSLPSECFRPSRRETVSYLYEIECYWNMSPQNMPLWRRNFELNATVKETTEKAPYLPRLPKSRAQISHCEGILLLCLVPGRTERTTGEDSRLSSPKMAQRGSDITKLSEHSSATTFTFPQCASSRSSKVFSKCLSLLYVFIVHCRSPWV